MQIPSVVVGFIDHNHRYKSVAAQIPPLHDAVLDRSALPESNPGLLGANQLLCLCATAAD